MAETKREGKKFQVAGADILPFGAYVSEDDLVISVPTKDKLTEIDFYSKATGRFVGSAEINESYRMADVYSFRVKKAVSYNYALKNGDKKVRDDYAAVVNKGVEFGKEKEILYGVYDGAYDWEGDRRPCHGYEDSFIYRLHVRGFTKHTSSGVTAKGTFEGVTEKIDYLKDLGVTAVELMPAYEFDEIIGEGLGAGRVNYWGYAGAHYFAPKESYSSKKKGGQVREFKDMVKQLHRAGIEVIMDFYFIPGTNPYLILDCLRYWVIEYHIDGVHVNMEVAPVNMIKEDPVLSGIKIFADMWDVADRFSDKREPENRRLAIFNDDFMINIRRFIKSDEEQVYGLADKLKRNPASCGIINYLSNHYTLTLMDSVSYGRKHNEENGEDNKDGTDYNYSWNCGMEGPTRKKRIKNLRIKQIKNALTILFLSQGTPMLYAGDEMGRSQRGNNNPYCQDNDISWINWNLLKTNAEIYEYLKKLIAFRKRHRVLHMKEEPKNMDYKSTGIPDISFHGTDPWRVDFSYGSRQLGVLYNGIYGDNEPDVYAVFNSYWEAVEFNIPETVRKSKWKGILVTESDVAPEEIVTERCVRVPARTIVVLETIKEAGEEKDAVKK